MPWTIRLTQIVNMRFLYMQRFSEIHRNSQIFFDCSTIWMTRPMYNIPVALMKWSRLTIHKPGIQLCDWQQRMSHENSYSWCNNWSQIGVERFLNRVKQLLSGWVTRTNLKLWTRTCPSLRVGYVNHSKILFYIFLFLTLVQKKYAKSIIKWVAFFLDHLFDFFLLVIISKLISVNFLLDSATSLYT